MELQNCYLPLKDVFKMLSTVSPMAYRCTFMEEMYDHSWNDLSVNLKLKLAPVATNKTLKCNNVFYTI